MIYITNTRSGQKELFVPYTEGIVALYVCGITPYDYAHLGHGRCYTTFDLLYRLLNFCGYQVRYCRNFTDIDDKLLIRAEKELGDQQRYSDIAQKYINAYHDDMRRLNCMLPTFEPRVTQTIPAIIEYIKMLIQKDVAYVVNGSVYFHIPAFSQYGALSRHQVADLVVGSRVEADPEKRDPLDFALWKAEPTDTFWPSPWGYGRPGWHIECSAMAYEYLGEYIDIHAGGLDLVFPHHENEIAQSEAMLGHVFGRYWMHNGFVQINKEKMSKSLGNFFTLQHVFAHYDPMIVRYYFLTHAYRSPLEFSFDNLDGVSKSYKKLVYFFASVSMPSVLDREAIKAYPTAQKLLDALCNDLNTPAFLGILFEYIHGEYHDAEECSGIKYLCVQVLGLTLQLLEKKHAL